MLSSPTVVAIALTAMFLSMTHGDESNNEATINYSEIDTVAITESAAADEPSALLPTSAPSAPSDISIPSATSSVRFSGETYQHPQGTFYLDEEVFVDINGKVWDFMPWQRFNNYERYRDRIDGKIKEVHTYDWTGMSLYYLETYSPQYWMYAENNPNAFAPFAFNFTDMMAALFLDVDGVSLNKREEGERSKDYGIYVPIVCLGLFVNLMMLAVIIKYKQLQSPTNYFLASMAIGDVAFLFIEATRTMFFTYYYRHTAWDDHFCKGFDHVRTSLYCLTIIHNIAIAFERYFAICWPMKVGMHCSKSRSLKIIVVLWILSFLLAAPKTQGMYRLGQKHFPVCLFFCIEGGTGCALLTSYLVGVLFAIPVCCMLFLYTAITRSLLTSIRQAKNMKGDDKKSSEQFKTRYQVVKLLWIVFFCFTASWLPNRIMIVIEYNYGLGKVLGYGYQQTYARLSKLAFANSIMNPILFFLMSRLFRNCVLHTLTCHRYTSKDTSPSTRGGVSSTAMTGVTATSTSAATAVNKV